MLSATTIVLVCACAYACAATAAGAKASAAAAAPARSTREAAPSTQAATTPAQQPDPTTPSAAPPAAPSAVDAALRDAMAISYYPSRREQPANKLEDVSTHLYLYYITNNISTVEYGLYQKYLDYLVNDQQFQKFDKTQDREVGDSLPNYVKIFYVTTPR